MSLIQFFKEISQFVAHEASPLNLNTYIPRLSQNYNLLFVRPSAMVSQLLEHPSNSNIQMQICLLYPDANMSMLYWMAAVWHVQD